jgi:hypothetical protein
MVRPRKDMEGADLDVQQEDMARELTRYDARDVEAGTLAWARRSKWWPTLAELIEAAETERHARDARAAIRALPPPSDWWSAPWQQLGIGLQIARGQCALEEVNTSVARSRFERVVDRLGLARAKSVADGAYKPGGDHRAILAALEQAAGFASAEPRAAA